MTPPTLRTARLVLRPFVPADAPDVHRLAGAREIAAGTLRIPHPYDLAMAETWIAGLDALGDQEIALAIARAEDGALVGSIGLMRPEHARAELGYWIGTPYWGRGYATEAAARLVAHGFETLGLHRVFAGHYARNPASGRVLEKIGMRREGVLRHHIEKWGVFEDLVMYGILREEWEASR